MFKLIKKCKKQENEKEQTKKDKDAYLEILQREERRRSGNRRKILKVLIAQDKAWPIFKSVFTEKVKVANKLQYSLSELEKNPDLVKLLPTENILKECIKNNEDICFLMIKYKKVGYESVKNFKDGYVLVWCKKEDYEKINVGDKIPIYLILFDTIDGTAITLYFYNYWSK